MRENLLERQSEGTKKGIKESNWYGCYSQGWQNILDPDAYSHPAKVAFALANRIYDHCFDQGYFKPGDTVIDPFFGIGGFAYHALLKGLNIIGVELEEKFVKLAQGNLDRWRCNYGPGIAVLDSLREQDTLPPYGHATLFQGDSRYLCDVLAEAGGCVSSPPYAESMDHAPGNKNWKEEPTETQARYGNRGYSGQVQKTTDYGTTPGQLGAMRVVSSPPYADGCQHTGGDDPSPEHVQGGKLYGVGIAGAVSSPPYAESVGSDDPDKRGGLYRDEKRRNDKTLTAEYGESVGQLGRMKVVSSPPYEGIINDKREGGERRIDLAEKAGYDRKYLEQKFGYGQTGYAQKYGNSDEQLGAKIGDDFWTAARQIMQQVALVLPPGAVAIWVTKRFVRDKQIVDFSQQWAALGEACGFETVEWIRAWLIEDRGAQYGLFDGEVHQKQVKRSSFFRRLYESKYPENSIDWEDVIIQRRLAT